MNVKKLVEILKKEGVPVGIGRGSECGSLVLYALGITEINPLNQVYGELLFFHWWFGHTNHRHANHNIIIEVGIDKNVDEIIINAFKKIDGVKAVRMACQENLYGLETKTIHPCGFIFDEEIKLNKLKTYKKFINGIEQEITCDDCKTFFDSDYKIVEIVPNKRVSIFNNSINEIKGKGNNICIDFKDCNPILILNNKNEKYYKNLEDFIKEFVDKLQPKTFLDLILLEAISIPGCKQHINEILDYRENVNNRDILLRLKDVLEESYYSIVYQEQITAILHIVGRFAWNICEKIRKDMSKRRGELLIEPMKSFIKSAKEYGYTEEQATTLWLNLGKASGNAFCKAQAVSQAINRYRELYIYTYYREIYDKYYI